MHLDSADPLLCQLGITKPTEADALQTVRLQQRTAFNNKYRRAMKFIDGIKERCPEVNVALVPTATGGKPKKSSVHFKRSELPKYSGKRREYPKVYDDWTGLVASDLSEKMQLHHLKDCVPEKDKVFIETCTSIEDF